MAVEVEVSDLLRVLVTVTERAANIARIIRAEKGLFESLVEEKQTVYVQQDFKTLADVLIQSVVNYYIVKQVSNYTISMDGFVDFVVWYRPFA